MKHTIPVLAASLALLTAPVLAQDDPAPGAEDGFSLMEEGARLFMRGLTSEAQPPLEEFRGLAEDFAPAFREFAQGLDEGFLELIRTLDDIRYYEAPVIIDNGDILIRRRDDAPDWVPPDLQGEEAAPDAETGNDPQGEDAVPAPTDPEDVVPGEEIDL